MRSPIWMVFCLLLLSGGLRAQSREAVFPGADEATPSRSEYFSWINNTNEGATSAQTLVNLDFFQWLHDAFGMKLDIYALDAGAIDGKRFYGRVDSDRFQEQFPDGFGPLVEKAGAMGTRLGVWGGPDGFGDTPEEEAARIEQMAALCRDFHFALFKFDAVCGALRPEKEDAFIRMMTLCRRYCPDLILLNHRLGLERARAQATTFLWEGKETYIDVFSTNTRTAPHHRADALSRGWVPGLKRLTEDHGVCLSSCLDFFEDDLVLQAFNRSLILAPQLYGNPWLLRDDEFPRLARIFNLHRKYREILVQGMALPEDQFGPFAVSRGDGSTRLVTLRNLTWEPVTYPVPLDGRIGLLDTGAPLHCRRFHPLERILGDFPFGASIDVTVPPFRSYLLLVTALPCDEPGVLGCDFEVVRNVPGKPVLIDLKGPPGTETKITLIPGNGSPARGAEREVRWGGDRLKEPYHRKLAGMEPCAVPADAEALYEATVFAGDNNALEVRSLERSGPTSFPPVQKARDAFFNQAVFRERGVWDRNLFDGDLETGFWPSRRYRIDQRVKGGCFRLDLGAVTDLDRIVLRVPDAYSLEPLLEDEGQFVDVSSDLRTWRRLTCLAGESMVIRPRGPLRYLRMPSFPGRIVEIEGYRNGLPVPREAWRASNLFAPFSRMKPVKAWHAEVFLDEWVEGSTLCIALEGRHGVEGAYAALKVRGRPLGCPDRAPSYPSNTWEYVNARREGNYTYYAPMTRDLVGVPIEVYVLAFDEKRKDFRPAVWVTAHPAPFRTIRMELD